MANMAEVRGQFGGASYAPNLIAEKSPESSSLSLGQRLSILAEAVENKGRVVALAAVLAACQSGSPTTPSPTRTPDATPSLGPNPTETYEPTPSLAPTPTITIEPTSSPTVSPTVEPTPTVTRSPEATPVSMRGIVDALVAEAEQNGGFTDISASAAQQSFEDAYAADPEAAQTISDPTFSDQTLIQSAKIQWKDCKTGSSGGDIEFAKYAGCRGLLENLWGAYQVNNSENFVSSIRDVLSWAENNLASEYKSRLIEDLRAFE